MDFVGLGRAGVKVSRLCLGTVNFGARTPADEAVRIVHRALDAGINFIDTANSYGRGLSEEIVGRALHGLRDRVVLATKVRSPMGDGPNDQGLSRYHVLRQVDESLRRLGTDHIDLYQLHAPDPQTPLEETLATFDDLVRAGKVRYIGTSNFPAWMLCRALWLADRAGKEAFVSEQPEYHLLNRHVEAELVPLARETGLALLPWSPLAGGLLGGRYSPRSPAPDQSRRAAGFWMPSPGRLDSRLPLVARFGELAGELGLPLSRFALAWVLAQPGVTAPIIGPRTLEHLEDNLKALEVQLPPEAAARVDALVPPQAVA